MKDNEIKQLDRRTKMCSTRHPIALDTDLTLNCHDDDRKEHKSRIFKKKGGQSYSYF